VLIDGLPDARLVGEGLAIVLFQLRGEQMTKDELMYGLIGKLEAPEDKRDALVEILKENQFSLPGCVSYVVAADVDDPNCVWITEVWASEDDHKASLQLPSVQSAISRARPLIVGMTRIAETRPT